VCLITAAFVRSTWCTSGVAVARSRGSLLLPVMAESGVGQPFLTSLQHVDLVKGESEYARLELSALQQVDAVGGPG
jgi:hypothetical protein